MMLGYYDYLGYFVGFFLVIVDNESNVIMCFWYVLQEIFTSCVNNRHLCVNLSSWHICSSNLFVEDTFKVSNRITNLAEF